MSQEAKRKKYRRANQTQVWVINSVYADVRDFAKEREMTATRAIEYVLAEFFKQYKAKDTAA